MDLDDDTITVPTPEGPAHTPFSLIGEIREREPSSVTPPAPAPPTPTASSTGFPAHRRRNRPSSFKERRANLSKVFNSPDHTTIEDDKSSIARENSQHLASMSDSQIQREREELMASMDPQLLQRFLRRANIDEDGKGQTSTLSKPNPDLEKSAAVSSPKKSVSFDVPSSISRQPAKSTLSANSLSRVKNVSSSKSSFADDLPPAQPPIDLHSAAQLPSLDPALIERFHFPQPKQPMPTLDPTSETFLSDLQSHYFPEITDDPASLSWLQPPSNDEDDPDSTSAYHPASSARSIAPSAIRFSLRGTVLSPTTSLSLPTTLGLHHHGDDPQAAGYTIPELAILSRSTFPAQRCVAWQVIGRILFRLGRGEFGDRGGQLSEGLWNCIEKEGIVAGMLAEAEGANSQGYGKVRDGPESKKSSKNDGDDTLVAPGIGRHASAAAWAVEGVWLWQKGGAGDRGLLKEGQIRSQ